MTAPQLRASHADRQAAVDSLARHFTQGRLDAGEFDERVGKAYAATYLDDLPALFVDLPDDRPRPGYGPGAGRPDRDRSVPFGPGGRPGPWPGPVHRPRGHRSPRILVALLVLALLFSIGAMTHGFFPFPLIWIAIVLLVMSRRGRRRRWADSGYHHR